MPDKRLIQCDWHKASSGPLETARIFDGLTQPEGFVVERSRSKDTIALPRDGRAEVLSVLRGSAKLDDPEYGVLRIKPGVHLYLPRGREVEFELAAGTEVVRVLECPEGKSSARGTELLVRNERYLAACATDSQMLRWIFTPQYVSRRIFLHHDRALISRNGDPVSWFHTTMFDVGGLPMNEEGEPVFKMSYNSRTEFNVLYDVAGDVRVRFAEHPYAEKGQLWRGWRTLDSESTYHLNEPREVQPLRNKHEVAAHNGHASLFCVFDPAPTGVEKHQPGSYSDYEALDVVSKRPDYAAQQAVIAAFDDMVQRLSIADAQGVLEQQLRTNVEVQRAHALFEQGLRSQLALEASLIDGLKSDPKRQAILQPWRVKA
jgi:hypothetical protein